MGRINRDVIVALLLLAGCGAFFHASFQIEETNYGTIQSWVWPRIVLTALTGACLLLLGQALLRGADTVEKPQAGFLAWAGRYRNAVYVYGLFFLFLVTLPYLGMLLGGVLFVFVTLTVLGRPQASLVPLHLAIAIGSIGAMWAIFTFALRVILPQGVILPF